jgi:oxygen-independent coproporphyrinogen-3 oxidase
MSGGEPVPADGALPEGALAGVGTRPFGFYVHVQFCTTRCGYCDFNTYTATELGARGAHVSPATYAQLVIREIEFARKIIGAVPVSTMFFGGGTPTLLAPAAIGQILGAIDAEFGLAPGAEVTSEANPESVTQASLGELRVAGVTRMSFGMQSAVPEVRRCWIASISRGGPRSAWRGPRPPGSSMSAWT